VTRNPFRDASDEEGVKGMHPLGYLPHWGREGVTLIPSSN